MNWVYTFLGVLVIIFSLYCFIYQENIYNGYEKDSWANNVRILGLLTSISIILFCYACQIGIIDKPVLGPFLCLTLFFYVIWVYSLTFIASFTITCMSSWIMVITTLSSLIVMGQTETKTLSLVGLPFFIFTILFLAVSYSIIRNNPERPDSILY